MPVVWIPSLLRDVTRGESRVEVSGRTVRQVVNNLEKAYPGIKERLCDGDNLDPSIAVAVDGELSDLGMLQPVEEQSEVHFLPAISGGEVIGQPIHDRGRGWADRTVGGVVPEGVSVDE